MLQRNIRLAPLCLFVLVCSAFAQQGPSTIPSGQLDPTRAIDHPQLFSSFHTPLPEQYIWTRDDSLVGKPGALDATRPGIDEQIEPHFFRATFNLDRVPADATLYIAGPRSAIAYINGTLAGKFSVDPLNPLGIHVFRIDVARLLTPGRNIVAFQVTRGRGVGSSVSSAINAQQTFGKVLVVKIVPARGGVEAPAILISGPAWKGALQAAPGWQDPAFDDSAWPTVTAVSPIEGDIDLFQWNADAGLYDWPGYEGASPFLAHIYLPAARVEEVFTGRSDFEHLDALNASAPSSTPGEFTVHLGDTGPGNEYAPALTLDFGREVNGRVQLISDSDAEAAVSIQYGESRGEVDHQPYLGVNVLRVPAHASAVGPKSAFRFARIRFLSGPPELKFKAIRLEDIYYPVQYQGAFESSDPLLNRIWATGAYTVHLCMQDDIWDAPKRDRGRWMGDTDVSGRVSDAVFFDHFLLKDTLTRLVGPAPVVAHVNTIPGYSSYWFTELDNYERHTGDRAYLDQIRPQFLSLLKLMERDFDAQHQYVNRTNEWLFVDWSLDLNGETSEAHRATAMEYYRAFLAAADLLRQLGDSSDADHTQALAAGIEKNLQQTAWSSADGDFGPRWQTNAMAVLSGVAHPDQYASIWDHVLSQVGQPTVRPNIITPYYGAYVLDALAKMHHRADALNWIRTVWGGMIAEGATSFWEAYDPSWSKDNFHADLQADNSAGYFVSLSHGWSTAPTYWLMEQVLGIRPMAPGFSQTVIRPDLIGLAWARGQEPTPQGLLKVDLRNPQAPNQSPTQSADQTPNQGAAQDVNQAMIATIDVPPGVHATVLFPIARGANHVSVNGAPQTGPLQEDGARIAIHLDAPGHYELRARHSTQANRGGKLR